MSLIAVITALLVVFAMTMMIAPWVLRTLRRRHAAQHILEIGPNWHQSKAGTPTMGGIMFILPFIFVMLVFMTTRLLKGDYRFLICSVFVIGCALIGFLDDFVKIAKAHNKGLTVRQKTMLLILWIALFLGAMYAMSYIQSSLFIPFINYRLPLGMFYLIIMLPISFFFVNSVNLTDGLDGLVSCVTLPYTIVFMLISVLLRMEGMGIFAAAVTGGLLAFLAYNFYPAKVFMGDTGSLFLGGCVVALAFYCDMPIILLMGGVIYWVEGLSVVLQVAYFKLTHGKRIFKMTPIHHHFEMCGKKETQIVWRFTIVSAIGALLSLAAVVFYKFYM